MGAGRGGGSRARRAGKTRPAGKLARRRREVPGVVRLTLASVRPGAWRWPSRRRRPRGLRLASRLSRPGSAGERARRRPGRARVPLVVVQGAPGPGPRVRSFRRRTAPGGPAGRDGTLPPAVIPPAVIRPAEIPPAEIPAAEVWPAEGGAGRAATETPHVLRARPVSVPAGVR
jgi:hypothetical protein